MLPVFLIFYLLGGFKLMVNLSSFAYPAYKSLQAIPVTSADEDKQWLTYWVFYGAFNILEGPITASIPYYNMVKLALFVYMYHSSTKGASKLYDAVVVPYVIPLISGA